MTPRILIITNGHLSRNPRAYKEAVTLGNGGFDVTVLSIRNHAPSIKADEELLSGAPFKQTCIDLLANAASDRVKRLYQKLRTWSARRLLPFAGFESIVSLGPARTLLTRARSLPSDLTIVHNELPHWVGMRLLAEGRRVAADIEDWHSEDLLPGDRRGRPLRLLRSQEQFLLRRASCTTTTSRVLAEALHARYGGNRPEVITNSFPLQPNFRKPLSEVPTFIWFSQTVGPGRGIEQFLNAWTQTQPLSQLMLLGDPADGYQARLLALLPHSFKSRIAFLPSVLPGALHPFLSRYDIGLALEENSIPSRDLTITNKILQYLNAGLALVATPTAGQREVLARSPEAGVFVDPSKPSEYVAVLDQLLGDRAALLRRQQAARRLAETHYCWEFEAPRLIDLVSNALRSPRC